MCLDAIKLIRILHPPARFWGSIRRCITVRAELNAPEAIMQLKTGIMAQCERNGKREIILQIRRANERQSERASELVNE